MDRAKVRTGRIPLEILEARRLLAPALAGHLESGPGPITFVGTATPGALVEVTADRLSAAGSPVNSFAVGQATAGADGSWSVEGTTPSDGSYLVLATATGVQSTVGATLYGPSLAGPLVIAGGLASTPVVTVPATSPTTTSPMAGVAGATSAEDLPAFYRWDVAISPTDHYLPVVFPASTKTAKPVHAAVVHVARPVPKVARHHRSG